MYIFSGIGATLEHYIYIYTYERCGKTVYKGES